MHHEEFKKEIKSIDQFFNEEKNKISKLESLFANGKEREKNKMKELENKIKFAKENEADLPDAKKIWDD